MAVFEEPLTDDNVKLIFSLGPGYIGCFQAPCVTDLYEVCCSCFYVCIYRTLIFYVIFYVHFAFGLKKFKKGSGKGHFAKFRENL